MSRFDVAIAGAGPAGCATALALARAGVNNVLLADTPRPAGRRIGESLPPDARVVLHRLGVLQRFLSDAHEPALGSCSSWGADDLGYNDFVFNPYGNGWHLDRARFDAMLLDEARAAGVTFRNTRFVPRAAPRPRFTVDATGSHAVVARSRGARRIFVDRLICVFGFFQRGDAQLSRLTMLEAVEYGWWYAARVPNGEIVAMLASDAATVRRLRATQLASWQTLLAETRHIAPVLNGCRFIDDTLRSTHAPTFILDRCAGDDWMAVGDAASAYDPISSAGIYKALDDGMRAAAAIIAATDGDRDAVEGYAASVRTRFDDYLANRAYFYRIERRFADAAFWRTRTA